MHVPTWIMKLTTFTVLLLLCLLVERRQAQNYTCRPLVEAPTCACELNIGGGMVVDLRSLAKQNGQPAFSVKAGDYTYTYNPCYPFTTGPGAGCSDVASCQQGISGYRSLGKQTDVQFDVVGYDLIFNYGGGSGGRSFEVTLTCRGVGEDEFVFDEEYPALHYKFRLITRCACPGYCNGGDVKDPGAV